MRFRILGPLEVRTGEDWTSIGAAKWRAILACLLLHPGQVVSTDTLIDGLWGNDPPARATNLVSIYVLRLRRLIGDGEGRVLKTRSPGYQLLLGPDDLDTQRFGILMSQGQEALIHGDPEHAARLLADSLALWRGKALADVPPSGFADAEAERLDELRLAALELRIEADIACGRYRDVIPALRRLLADQPLKEELWLLLMRALDGAGRRAEALGVYEQARAVIADQLGVDPGREIQRLFQQLLSADARQSLTATKRPPATAPGGKQPADAATARGGKQPADAGQRNKRRLATAESAGFPVADHDGAGPPALRIPVEAEPRHDPVPATSTGPPGAGGASGPPGSIALGVVETGDSRAPPRRCHRPPSRGRCNSPRTSPTSPAAICMSASCAAFCRRTDPVLGGAADRAAQDAVPGAVGYTAGAALCAGHLPTVVWLLRVA